MIVNKYKLKIPNLSGSTGLNIPLPISQNMGLVGQEDIINRKFVDIEVKNSINEIFDYEKVKLLPKNYINDTMVKSIMYDLNFLDDSGEYLPNTYWSNLGMDYDDFKFRKNNFIKSHLRLDFYDSDVNSTQRLIFFITLFPKFALNDLLPNGNVPQPNNYPVNFKLGNTILNKTLEGEGFSLYHFKDEILPTVPKELFMRATFNNAKTGKSTKFMVSDNPNLSVDTLIRSTNFTNLTNNLHTKYLLKREVDGYYYTIDLNYSNNVSNLNDNYVINLHEISSI